MRSQIHGVRWPSAEPAHNARDGFVADPVVDLRGSVPAGARRKRLADIQSEGPCTPRLRQSQPAKGGVTQQARRPALVGPWSDQARNSLRQTLTVLRRDLGPGHGELLRADRDVVALDPGLLDHDAHSFLASVALGTTQGLQAAADLYRGPFLDGFFAGEGEFENWARAERKRLLSLAIEALHELARRAGPEGGGLVHGKRLLSLEPTREATYRLLMALNAAAGHKALQLYAACRDMMSRVYGVEPSAETAATRARIAMGAGFAMPRANDSPPVPSEAAASVERMPTVRVLNFVNLTGGDDPDGLPRGLADEIIAALLRQRGIVVLPERSPGASGGTPPPNGDARYILSGSVQTVANRIRVNAQLIDVALGTHLWAE